jgi:LacI family transcriptional regulator
MKNVTIKDIAKKAGLTHQAVSYILKHQERLAGQKNADKVLKLVKELDYHPNYQARSLITGKTECIGVAGGLMDSMDNPAISQSYSGIGKVVQLYQFNMTFFPVGPAAADPLMVKAVKSRMVDGLIIFVFSTQHKDFVEQTLPALRDTRVPVVALHSTTKKFPCHNVGYNSPRAGAMATEHLLEQGIRSVGFIGLKGKGRVYNDQLYQGYEKAMQKVGLPVHDLRYWSGPYQDNAVHGYAFGKKLVTGDIPEGLVVHADTFAYGLMDALKEAGKQIPEDIAIVSIDNVMKPEVIRTGLTTVDRRFEERGLKAAEMLFGEIQNGKKTKKPISYIAEPELIVRESSLINC